MKYERNKIYIKLGLYGNWLVQFASGIARQETLDRFGRDIIPMAWISRRDTYGASDAIAELRRIYLGARVEYKSIHEE